MLTIGINFYRERLHVKRQFWCLLKLLFLALFWIYFVLFNSFFFVKTWLMFKEYNVLSLRDLCNFGINAFVFKQFYSATFSVCKVVINNFRIILVLLRTHIAIITVSMFILTVSLFCFCFLNSFVQVFCFTIVLKYHRKCTCFT